LPKLQYNVRFTVPDGRSSENWRLSSDHHDQQGESMHADWISGWIEGRELLFTRDVINKGLNGGSTHAGNQQEWF
jgi:hypothetical protein